MSVVVFTFVRYSTGTGTGTGPSTLAVTGDRMHFVLVHSSMLLKRIALLETRGTSGWDKINPLKLENTTLLFPICGPPLYLRSGDSWEVGYNE